MKISDLRPAEYNPRKITDEKLRALKGCIEEFGDLSGFVFNRRTGNLVCGHQRLKCIPRGATIKKTKLDTATKTGTVAEGCVLVGGERWGYREVDWGIEREKMANIAANKHGGDWDEDKLGEIMRELSKSGDIDMDLSGFDFAEIEEMIAGESAKADSADSNAGESGMVPDKEDNILVRISVNPGMWLGKRGAILATLEKMKKVYNIEYNVKE